LSVRPAHVCLCRPAWTAHAAPAIIPGLASRRLAASGDPQSRARDASLRGRAVRVEFLVGNLRRCFVIEPVVPLNLPAQPLRSALEVFDLFLGHRSIQSQVRPKPHRRSPRSSRQDRRPSDPGYRAGEAHPALQSRRSHTARHITVSIPASPVSSSTPTREEILQ
jgi:hypothetical protein